MSRYKLYLYKIDLGNPIIFELENFYSLVDLISARYHGKDDKLVFSISAEKLNSFVTDGYENVLDYLVKMDFESTYGEYHLKEFNSFEEAYRMAFYDTEGHELHLEPKLPIQKHGYLDLSDFELFPVRFKEKDYYKKDCDDMFLAVYNDKCQLTEYNSVYIGDGSYVYPDGSMQHDKNR